MQKLKDVQPPPSGAEIAGARLKSLCDASMVGHLYVISRRTRLQN